MSVNTKVDPELKSRLDELRETYGDNVKVEDVADVVDSLMTTMKGDVTSADMGSIPNWNRWRLTFILQKLRLHSFARMM